MFKAVNPALNRVIKEYPEYTQSQIEASIQAAHKAFDTWSQIPLSHRKNHMQQLGALLRKKLDDLAGLITTEMGKPIKQAKLEVEKCATACDYYAMHAEAILADEVANTVAFKSFISFEPLGIILGVMPWNFPFWQVFRFITPALMAGNAVLLKHASNVPGCALEIESLIKEAGFPEGVLKTLLISSQPIQSIIDDPRVKAVTLTGSETAGAAVGSSAGKALKKTVLELGGSDPFIVLEDADIPATVSQAIQARLNNGGQSCIAAKRFIIVAAKHPEFCQALLAKLKDVKIGDPLDPANEMGPLAKEELLQTLERQVKESIAKGAKLMCGGKKLEQEGFFYPPTVLTQVQKGMPVFDEETFGPVFAIISVKDVEEAIAIANISEYGLGASLWTKNLENAEKYARRIQSGSVFVNSRTVSDLNLPFGGVKKSGYGRELSHYGLKEFVNIKSISITPG